MSLPRPPEPEGYIVRAPVADDLFASRIVGIFPTYDEAKAVALAAGTASVWMNSRLRFKCFDGRDANANVQPIAVTTICGLNETARPAHHKPKKKKFRRKP